MNREQRRHPSNGHEILNVPILGPPKVLGKARVGAQLGAIPRKLDENGTFGVDVMQGADGKPSPKLPREAYLDAEELLAAIREIVREELAALLEKTDAQ